MENMIGQFSYIRNCTDCHIGCKGHEPIKTYGIYFHKVQLELM